MFLSRSDSSDTHNTPNKLSFYVKAFLFSSLTCYAFFRNTAESTFVSSFICAGIFACVFLIMRFSASENVRLRFAPLFAIIPAFFFLWGRIVFGGCPHPWDLRSRIICLFTLAGFYCFHLLLMQLFAAVINRVCRCSRLYGSSYSSNGSSFAGRLINGFQTSPFVFSFVTLLVCHLPHLLIKYPAAFCYDASWQVEQGLGVTPLTTHHPVFHTLLLGGFVRLGKVLGSANIGIFLFVILQMILCAAIDAYAVSLTVSMKAPLVCSLFTLAFFSLFPFVTAYVGEVIKDALYNAFFLLFMLQLLKWVINRDTLSTRRDRILLLLPCLFVCLTRKNGIYILVPTLAAMILRERADKSKSRHRIVFLLVCAILPLAADTALNKITGAQSGSIAEALSMPIQQTARFVSSGYPMTPEEEKAVNAVLPVDKLPDLYNAFISDPVKSTFNPDADTSDLIAFFKAWAAMGTRHPVCYFEAAMDQNFFFFYPEYNDFDVSAKVTSGSYPWREPVFTPVKALAGLQDGYEIFYHNLHRAPVLSVIFGFFTYNVLTFMLLCLMITKKIRGRWFLFLPLILSALIVAAGPCICYHPRYCLPIIYAFPVLLCYLAASQNS